MFLKLRILAFLVHKQKVLNLKITLLLYWEALRLVRRVRYKESLPLALVILGLLYPSLHLAQISRTFISKTTEHTGKLITPR